VGNDITQSLPSNAVEAAEQDHDRVLALVRRYGWNATSFQALDLDMRHFWCGEDAWVAYADTGEAWVAAGAPLAAEERIGEVARAFVRGAAAAGRRASFFAVDARFVEAAGFASLPIARADLHDAHQRHRRAEALAPRGVELSRCTRRR
jgi:phosphatidylglycerol lysyltransferase